MSIAEKLTTIAENEQRVFEAGKQTVLNRSNETEKTESGKVVSIYDGSPLHNVTVRLTSDTITDFSGIKVTKYGKNVTPLPFYDGLSKDMLGVSWRDNKDGTISVSGKATSHSHYLLSPDFSKQLVDGKRYVIRSNGENVPFILTGSDSEGSISVYNGERYFTVDKSKYTFGNLYVHLSTGKTADETVMPLLIEVDSETEELTANADGMIQGFTPTASMTFVTDNPDVNLTVTYHKSYGSQTEYDRFWNEYQDNGYRTNYSNSFFGANWNDRTYKPKYKVVATGDATQMYRNSYISRLTNVDTSGAANVYYLIWNATRLEYIDKLDFSSATNTNGAIAHCGMLHTIGELVSSENTVWHNQTFTTLAKLENLTLKGVIATNFTCTIATLTHDSLMSIINCLKDYGTTATHTCTLGTTNLAKLTDSEKAIATQKGWTLA